MRRRRDACAMAFLPRHGWGRHAAAGLHRASRPCAAAAAAAAATHLPSSQTRHAHFDPPEQMAFYESVASMHPVANKKTRAISVNTLFQHGQNITPQGILSSAQYLHRVALPPRLVRVHCQHPRALGRALGPRPALAETLFAVCF